MNTHLHHNTPHLHAEEVQPLVLQVMSLTELLEAARKVILDDASRKSMLKLLDVVVKIDRQRR